MQDWDSNSLASYFSAMFRCIANAFILPLGHFVFHENNSEFTIKNLVQWNLLSGKSGTYSTVHISEMSEMHVNSYSKVSS